MTYFDCRTHSILRNLLVGSYITTIFKEIMENQALWTYLTCLSIIKLVSEGLIEEYEAMRIPANIDSR